MTGTNNEAQVVIVLDKLFYICYPMQFQKDKDKDVLALLNSENEVNAMTLAYMAQVGLKVQKTDFAAQKIDKSSLETYGMVIAAFQILISLVAFVSFRRFFFCPRSA